MAITFDDLCAVLDAGEIKYRPYDESTLLTVFSWEDERVDLVCSLWEDGEFLDIRTINLAHLPRHGTLAARALPSVSRLNYAYKVARVSWDEDGELVVGASLPIEDRPELTRDQVAGLITAVCQVAVDLRGCLVTARAEPIQDDEDGHEDVPRGALATIENRSLARLLLSLGVFMIGLASLIAAAALWVR